MNIQQVLAAFAVSTGLLLTGCAHNIKIDPTPQLAKNTAKSTKTAGVFITKADRDLTVESPGGGGDRLSYSPYKDLEGPISFMLLNVYSKVESLPANDAATIAAHKVNLVLTPKITTTSSSTSAFTWPPTDFSVTIKATALDNTGKTLWEETTTGSGKAEFKEFVADHALAARRASRDALNKLEAAIRKREGLN